MTAKEFYDRITHIVDDSPTRDYARELSDEFFEEIQIMYEDAAQFWQEQFQIANLERNELKEKLKQAQDSLDAWLTPKINLYE